jgi:hypothetical protein
MKLALDKIDFYTFFNKKILRINIFIFQIKKKKFFIIFLFLYKNFAIKIRKIKLFFFFLNYYL